MTEPFDLAEVEERRKSVYVSKKDLVLLLVGAAMVLAVAVFFYAQLKRQAESSVCLRTMREVSRALSLYQAANNDRFPPAYAVGADGGVLMEEGYVLSWASLVRENMSERVPFRCPTAKDEEVVRNRYALDEKGFFESAYGFYAPRSFMELNRIVNPDQAVVIAETSNLGAMATFDPVPLTDPSGVRLPYDGFLIGWNDGNEVATEMSNVVTRLAFPETSNGVFSDKGKSRHENGNHVLFASGAAGTIKPPGARIVRVGAEIVGYWAVR